MRHGLAFAPLAVALLSVSCDLPTALDADERLTRDLEAAMARWEDATIRSYDLQVERDCYCVVANEPVRVRVRSDVILDAIYVRSGEPVPSHYTGLFPSVRGMFAVIEDAIDRDVDDLEVDYDPEFGFPTYIRVDPRRGATDDEYEIFAGNLRLR